MIKQTITKPFFIQWIFNIFKINAFTSFWDTIYYREEKHMHDEGLIRHEVQHLRQIEREGKFKFFFKYTWWLIRYGYKNNPYEIEARGVENDA